MNTPFRGLVVLFALLSSLLATAIPAWAWDNDGHRVVCELAFDLLEKGTQTQVTGLVAEYEHPDGERYASFGEGCFFPDLARARAREYEEAVQSGKQSKADKLEAWKRFAPYTPWHYLDMPRDARKVQEEHCDDDCILSGIEEHSTLLSDGSLDSKQHAEALFFLGHWMADLHQPLHVSYADDDHGETIFTEGFYGPHRLYDVWNTRMVDKASRNELRIREYVSRLHKKIKAADHTSWTSGDAVAWADESYQIATQASFRYCRWDGDRCVRMDGVVKLLDTYRDEFHPVAEKQLMKAAVRLAARIETALGD